MAPTPVTPLGDDTMKKEDLEFTHLEKQEMADCKPGAESPVYGIDEAHQKRVMYVPHPRYIALN